MLSLSRVTSHDRLQEKNEEKPYHANMFRITEDVKENRGEWDTRWIRHWVNKKNQLERKWKKKDIWAKFRLNCRQTVLKREPESSVKKGGNRLVNKK